MIQTSEKYKEGIKADTELVECRAEVSFVPAGAIEGAELDISTARDCTKMEQLMNGAFGMDGKWATLEASRLVLNGSMSFIQREGAKQVGFFGNQVCGADGVFAEPDTIQMTLDKAYDILAVSIAFDNMGMEWATEVVITCYGVNGDETGTATFANDAPMFFGYIRQKAVKEILVVFKKWNVPNRVCKVSQIVPGYVLSFASEGILEFELEEGINPFSSSVTFPESTIVFDNTGGEFNIINPNGMISYLRQKMKIAPRLDLITGVRTDSIGMGNFYLYSFPKTDQSEEARITFRPSIAFESGNYSCEGHGTQTVEDAVSIIFANVTEPVVIDEELKGILVNQHIGDNVPIHTALGYLAIACCGYWKFERDGSYHLKKWKVPEKMLDAITYDELYQKPSISMGEKFTSCTAKWFAWDSENEKIVGTPVEVTNDEEEGSALSITSYFICSEEQARQVAETYMAYRNLRLDHNANYRGDMSLEAGDPVTIQNDFEHSEVVILKHTISFNTEGVSGKIVGKGLN